MFGLFNTPLPSDPFWWAKLTTIVVAYTLFVYVAVVIMDKVKAPTLVQTLFLCTIGLPADLAWRLQLRIEEWIRKALFYRSFGFIPNLREDPASWARQQQAVDDTLSAYAGAFYEAAAWQEDARVAARTQTLKEARTNLKKAKANVDREKGAYWIGHRRARGCSFSVRDTVADYEPRFAIRISVLRNL